MISPAIASSGHVIIPASRASSPTAAGLHIPSSNIHFFPATNHRRQLRLRPLIKPIKSSVNFSFDLKSGTGSRPVNKPNVVITSADELFLNGVILPTKLKTICLNPEAAVLENEVKQTKQTCPEKSCSSVGSECDGIKTNFTFIYKDKETASNRKRLKELLCENDDKKERSLSGRFWKFTRTTSLNSSNDGRPKRLFRSLSWEKLLHTNSTLNHSRENEDIKLIEKANSRKEPTISSSCFSCNGVDLCRQSLTKKHSGGGTHINPVLNILPANNMNFFGYGTSLFCKGKSRGKTK